MKNTLRSRLGGAVVAFALGTTTLATVGAVSPVGAATVINCTTTATVQSSLPSVTYGYSTGITGHANGACPTGASGQLPYGTTGLLQIQASTDGVTWSTVETGTSAGSAYYSHQAGVSTFFRSYRPAGTYTTGSGTSARTYNFPAAVSPAIRVVTERVVDLSSKRVRAGRPIPVTWKSSPAAPGIILAKKPGKKKFKLYKRVSVTPGGTRFKVRLPLGTKLRFIINADSIAQGWTLKTRIRRTY